MPQIINLYTDQPLVQVKWPLGSSSLGVGLQKCCLPTDAMGARQHYKLVHKDLDTEQFRLVSSWEDRKDRAAIAVLTSGLATSGANASFQSSHAWLETVESILRGNKCGQMLLCNIWAVFASSSQNLGRAFSVGCCRAVSAWRFWQAYHASPLFMLLQGRVSDPNTRYI